VWPSKYLPGTQSIKRCPRDGKGKSRPYRAVGLWRGRSPGLQPGYHMAGLQPEDMTRSRTERVMERGDLNSRRETSSVGVTHIKAELGGAEGQAARGGLVMAVLPGQAQGAALEEGNA